jgi:alkanesulfonate monooxygenase SsuD/methylene tetrahydromethanopterin reductase-like flavin-dependent oxidoreductase (luciferase family)
MRFGFGGISCQRYPGDPRTDVELYEQAVALAEAAEECGYDSVWVAEHHFSDDAFLPSLLPLCAAFAARTRRITIGTAVVLAPLHEPVRLAEDAAVVDLLSHGRFILGLGQGYIPTEFEAFRVDSATRHLRLEDTVATLRQAWSGDLVVGGDQVVYPGVVVTPQPAQPDGPPIWIGGGTRRSIRRAGRIADGFVATYVADPGVLADQCRFAREGLADAGRSEAGFRFAVSVPTFAWPGEDGWALVRDSVHYMNWKYSDLAVPRDRRGGPRPAPPPTSAGLSRLREQIVLGTPAAVAEHVKRLADAAGGEFEMIARLYWPGMPFDVQRRALEVFAAEVIGGVR